MRPPRVKLIVLGLVLASGGAGCAQEEPIVPRDLVRPVKMLTVGVDSIGRYYEYPGSVDATLNATMSFEVAGLITEILVTEGQAVSEGQVLARLDPRDYEAQRDAALAMANERWADYQRYQELYTADAASVQELDLARRSHEVAESQLRIAQKAVDDTELRARFAGTLSRRLVEEFENVQAKDPVVVVQDESQLEIKFNIPESDAGLWHPGWSIDDVNEQLELLVALTARPDRPFEARISEMATTADPVTRTFEITLRFTPDPDVTARTGMTAIVRANRDDVSEVFMIPASAVIGDEQGQSFVWKVDSSSGRVSRTAVEIGDISGPNITILSGLSLGDTIATAGAHSLADGMQVRPMTRQ